MCPETAAAGQGHSTSRPLAEQREHRETIALRRPGTSVERLGAVLEAYARLSGQAGGLDDSEFAAILHRAEGEVARALDQVVTLVGELIAEAAAAGDGRDDVSPD
jgi:hypothetical protein